MRKFKSYYKLGWKIRVILKMKVILTGIERPFKFDQLLHDLKLINEK